MFKKIVCIVLIGLMCSGCVFNVVAQHNYLYASNCASVDTDNVTSPASDLVDLKRIGDQTVSEAYEQILEQGSLLGSFYNFPDIEVNSFSLNNVEKVCSAISFDAMSTCDIKDVNVVLYFDNTKERVSFTISAMPASTVVQGSVEIPDGAKKVGIYSVTWKDAQIAVGERRDLHSNDQKLQMISNNSLAFDIVNESRFLIYDSYGTILDDITIAGRGSIVTANGAAFAKEVEVY